MNSKWQRVKLGEVLRYRKEFITIDDLATYKRPRVQLHTQGIVLRDEIPGALIKTKQQQVCNSGEFLVAEIDAKVGGFGIVPKSLDGAIVSSHYFLYVLDDSKLDRNFLDYFSRTPTFSDQIAAQGSTNYAAIRPADVLSYEIPLPPLEEQRRIVARIEEQAAQINEARTLQHQAEENAENLLITMAHRRDLDDESKKIEGWKNVSLGEVLQLVDDSQSVRADLSYPNLGIYSFGRGLFPKPPIDGALTSAINLRRVRSAQFIYSRLFAFEGAYGIVTKDYDGFFVSNEYPTFDCDSAHIRPEFLAAYFKSPQVWKDVAIGSKGLGDRRQRVQPTQVLSHRFWLPPLEWQNRIVQLQEQLEGLRCLAGEAAVDLEAVLPSILAKAFKGPL
jgi:type I restriction enzyme S subunit